MISKLKLYTILEVLGINPNKPSYQLAIGEKKEIADAILGLDLAVCDANFTTEIIKMLIADLAEDGDVTVEEIIADIQGDVPTKEITVAKAEELLASIAYYGPIKIVPNNTMV